MSDPSFGLDLRRGTSQLGLSPEGQSESGSRQDADPQAALQFQKAMGLSASVAAEPAALPSGPFALFGAATPPAPVVRNEGLQEVLCSMVDKLMVGDGRQSQRSVRLELADDVMPGVSLSLFEEAGAMVAEFECRNADSFATLSESAQASANQLAVTLGRNTVWRVIADPTAGMRSQQPLEAFGFASA
jgi:hypothetical protein